MAVKKRWKNLDNKERKIKKRQNRKSLTRKSKVKFVMWFSRETIQQNEKKNELLNFKIIVIF